MTLEASPTRTNPSKALVHCARWILRFIFSRRMLYLLIVMSTLLAIAWQVENWRGRARWEKAKAEILARGDSLDWRTFVPDAIPDEENAAMHPVFDVTVVPQGPPTRENGGYPYMRKFNELEKQFFSDIPLERFRDQSRLDLDLWHQALLNESATRLAKDSKRKATDILSATSKAAAGIELIAEAFSRPRCQWFPMADQLIENKQRLGQISYCSSVGSSLAATTSIRALAHLENGNSSAAAREIITSLRFSRSAAEDPSLTSVLLTMGMGSDACRHLPQLLTHPNWSEGYLKALLDSIASTARRKKAIYG